MRSPSIRSNYSATRLRLAHREARFNTGLLVEFVNKIQAAYEPEQGG
jgi:hypothetical protein